MDIGNSFAHVYENGRVFHLEAEEAVERYGTSPVFYICVRESIKRRIATLKSWRDISERLKMDGFYRGMGADRKALCLSGGDALYVDVGSAITLDLVAEGRYKGGLILPGFSAQREALSKISPLLLTGDGPEKTDCAKLRRDTLSQCTCGMLASTVSLIEKEGKRAKRIYICGGGGKMVSKMIDGAIYREGLVFEGMRKVLSIAK